MGICKYCGRGASGNGVSGSSGAEFITHVIPSCCKNIGIATPAPHKYNDGKISVIPGRRRRSSKLQTEIKQNSLIKICSARATQCSFNYPSNWNSGKFIAICPRSRTFDITCCWARELYSKICMNLELLVCMFPPKIDPFRHSAMYNYCVYDACLFIFSDNDVTPIFLHIYSSQNVFSQLTRQHILCVWSRHH